MISGSNTRAPADERVLVIGAGLLGHDIADAIASAGSTTIVCSRRQPSGYSGSWRQLDVTDAYSCRRICEEVVPTVVVLAHGPSSIEWCTANPRAAMEQHRGATWNIAGATDAWILLASSDNVFPGVKEAYFENDRPNPANAYGRAKLAAEQILASRGNSLSYRISLVYGWQRPGGRDTFFHRTVRTLRRGEYLSVPDDQWTTPVVVDDVAAAMTCLTGAQPTGVLHLGGPDRVDRVTWARTIAECFGLPAENVIAVPRRQTQYADRPPNSCLRSARTPSIPALSNLPLRGVREAAEHLRRTAPA